MNFEASKLYGIVPPLVTPFDSSGNLNLPATRQLIESLVGSGVNAIFIGGTTGEAASMSAEELGLLTTVTVEAVAGRVPVLVGITAPSLKLTLERIELVAAAWPQALVAHPPFYFPHSQNELYRFYKEIAAASELPIMLYNIPQTTKVLLETKTVLRLAGEEPKIIGYKDSSNNLTKLRELIFHMQSVRPDFRFFLGSDVLQDTAIKMGAHGTIPSLANLFPEVLVAAYRAACEGDWSKATRLVEQIINLTAIYSAGKESVNGNIIASLKYGLTLKGIPAGKPRLPLLALDADGEASVQAILGSACNLIAE